MPSLESKIESILLFKNEPVTLAELSQIIKAPQKDLESAISNLQKKYSTRGIVLVTNGDEVSLGTHPDNTELIVGLEKEELSRELGRAGLETLAIVLYRGPVSRREVDHIRGVNSSYVLRSLLIRGLIERGDPPASTSEAGRAGRSFSYKPTLKLLEYLGVTCREELPDYENAFEKISEFVKTEAKEDQDA